MSVAKKIARQAELRRRKDLEKARAEASRVRRAEAEARRAAAPAQTPSQRRRVVRLGSHGVAAVLMAGAMAGIMG